ncbi:uncharacterized protein ColSpa_05183 [Colletotrichum spaethianum]|uniref:Uncharacterized protein n=1 Tax=Colletotrichum spaethianum TaxID=700344 RepID=A0AA37LAR6_9PEZI|nr:uncharacterized protein ColSpa_05183 [Colletotrichum spaethianum]GKT45002.1 hypothetical protein ColSpa_05183 [Colletotrichum spaethianum]
MQAGILLLIAATARAAASSDSNSTSPTMLLSTAPACAVSDGLWHGPLECAKFAALHRLTLNNNITDGVLP